MTRQEAGRLGGRAHLRKYSREHFVMIGRKGGKKSVEAKRKKKEEADGRKRGT